MLKPPVDDSALRTRTTAGTGAGSVGLFRRRTGLGDFPVSDVVIQFPVRAGAESQLFGSYLAEFMVRCSDDAEQFAADSDAPYLMVRSDPMQDVEVKVLTFQQTSAAQAFSQGWALAKTRQAAGGR